MSTAEQLKGLVQFFILRPEQLNKMNLKHSSFHTGILKRNLPSGRNRAGQSDRSWYP